MEIKGTIIQVMPVQSGVSKQGNAWQKKEFVIETFDNFKTKVKFDLFGDKVGKYPLKEGDIVTVHFDVESREFNYRWYTELKAWKVELNPT